MIIQTYTGLQFDVANPQPEMVCIEDIAHALSCIPRFGGHTLRFYSVAQHSVHVSRLVPEHQAKIGLLHDAAEAYMLDMMTPIKSQLPDYQALYNRVEDAVFRRFGIVALTPAVKRADLVALATEKRDLMRPTDWWSVDCEPDLKRIEPMDPEEAEDEFLTRCVGVGL